MKELKARSQRFSSESEPICQFVIPDVPNGSSLTLQMLLFTNVYAAPIWMASSIYYFHRHAFGTDEHYEKILAIIFFIVASPLEACRLYLGYSGNLREKVDVSTFYEFIVSN